jgi:hypothetical protein
MTDIVEAFEAFADMVAEKVEARLQQAQGKMIPQGQSDLGPRKHREAVKRRLANREGGAGITKNGRQFLLTREALQEELARGAERPPSTKKKRGGGGGSAPAAAPAPKSRAREMSEFERDLMNGLRDVE